MTFFFSPVSGPKNLKASLPPPTPGLAANVVGKEGVRCGKTHI